ncbi:Crp/Fnr family transcriptional regulator [Clostridium minihomine]|uniref:Crp/Fnr family transcriptional regulator n=1 Tax=Clostridium minihomine TaxID=2045012 RepID=UPI000C761449|nr:Crp/Fnr family transcriptional regulator [Clostridium minihomine]
MKQYLPVLQSVPLFQGISGEDCEKIISCLGASVKTHPKNQILLLAGEPVDFIGIILDGRVQVTKEDMLGNRSIMAEFSAGEIFGESLACAGVGQSPVTVVSVSGCTVMRLAIDKILSPCTALCDYHSRLIQNMVHLLAQKNVYLNRKMEILSQKSIREKVLAYLNELAKRQATMDPVIPFSREELADFLCVNRSALSKELGKMQEENLIRFHRNRFSLYPNQREKQ